MWGCKHQKRIKTRFLRSILIFTLFGQKSPKFKILRKKMFSRLKKCFWINAQEPNFVPLYFYTAQNISSELLSAVLKKHLFEIKTKTLDQKVHPLPFTHPPQNCNNFFGGRVGVKSQLAILTRFVPYLRFEKKLFWERSFFFSLTFCGNYWKKKCQKCWNFLARIKEKVLRKFFCQQKNAYKSFSFLLLEKQSKQQLLKTC